MKNVKFFKSTLLLLLFMIVPGWVFSQTIIRGTVTDTSNETLVGVSVMEFGTNNGTVTNIEGKYELKVSNPNATLNFSYVGYKSKTVQVSGQQVINVILESDVVGIDEVVVVGYGTQRRSDVTGAISSVNAETLKEVQAANMTQALQGRVAGVNISQTSTRPGASTQVRIRGSRSLNATNDPLIVVDGIPFAGSINDIVPADIKSIDILKDASATAIYGSRAANGVILVSTYRGLVTNKPQLTYTGSYGIKTVAEQYEVFNAEEFVKFRDAAGWTQYLPQELDMMKLGRETDWQKLLYKTGYVTEHNLKVTNGTEKGRYSFGLGYYDETTVLPGQDYQRFSIRLAVDQDINKWLKAGLTSQNSYGITNGEGASMMYQMLTMSPLAPVYNSADVYPYNNDGSVYMQPIYPNDDYYNPLLVYDQDSWIQRRKRFTTFNSLYGELLFTDWLKYRMNVGVTYTMSDYGHFYGSETPFRNGTISEARRQFNPSLTWTWENMLQYDKAFGIHKINAVAMYSAEENESSQFRANALDMAADFMQYYNLGYYKEGTGNITIPSGDQWYSRRALLSLMGRVNYAYDNRYMLTGTVRRDGSSVLAKGHNWHTYFAASAGWNIIKEAFMQNQSVFSNLKLRAGFGQTASQGINPYSTLGSLAQNKYNFGDTKAFGYYVQNLPNTTLSWEPTDTWNIGLDFSIFHETLSGSVEWYRQHTFDLLYQKSLPPTAGVTGSVWVNDAETENKGMEFTLTANVFKAKKQGDFSWSLDANLTFNKNKILSLSGGRTIDESGGFFVGQPIDVIYGYEKIGIWQLDEKKEAEKYGFEPGQVKIRDYSGPEGKPDSVINEYDRHVYGKFAPDFEGGLTSRMEYKNFDLTVVSFFRVGGTLVSQIHQGNSYLNPLQGRRNQIKVDYWTPTNPTNEYPAPDASNDQPAGTYSNTLGFYDAGFLKIRSINLGYTIPKKLLKNYGVSDLRVYATVQNPFVFFSDYMKRGGGVDPEATNYASSGYTGGNGGIQDRQLVVGLNTPPTRNYILGLSITF
ncbi:SusC/RagA family TonB-linked outer membrane protein [uncultured Paludibacter sp.]|nr:SusC/RagA family TonB-linked outer membrane protein [uncultured Paludibacter sp.]